MSDFAQLQQDYNFITITTESLEAIGVELRANGPPVPVSAAWPAANRAIYIPFVVNRPFIAVKMFLFNGGTASGNVDVGIYDSAGNKMVTMGTTAQAGTTTLQTFDITDTTLNPGLYYMACAMDGTTGTALRYAPLDIRTVRTTGVLSQSTAFVLPASATYAAAQDVYVPVMGVTSRATI